MARQFAQIKLSIWSDDDFRTLSPRAQHLYFVLLTSPTLSHCGVVDWRPSRIAALAGSWTREGVQAAADELVERLYLVIDEDTEEALIRSFVRHDELMKQPKMAVSMANAHAGMASAVLRGVVVHELRRLHEEHPEFKGWESEVAADLLGKASVDPSTYPLGGGPPGGQPGGSSSGANGVGQGSRSGKSTPKATPSGSGSGKGSPSPAPIPAPTTNNQHHADASHPDAADASSGADVVPLREITSQTVVAAFVDACRSIGYEPITGQAGRVGRTAKQLIDAGNDPQLVLDAAVNAALQGHAAVDAELLKQFGRGFDPPRQAKPSTSDTRAGEALAAGAEVQAMLDDHLGGAA